MFEILSEMGFPKHLFALLELSALDYIDELTDIRWNGRHSSAFTIERSEARLHSLTTSLHSIFTVSQSYDMRKLRKLESIWVEIVL